MTAKELAELVTAIASIMWPLVAFGSVLIFKTDIKHLLGRIRKGKLFGQEVELDESIDRLRGRVDNIRAKEPQQVSDGTKGPGVTPVIAAPSNDATSAEKPRSTSLSSDIGEIIELSSSQPTSALLRLSEALEREIRLLAVSTVMTNVAEAVPASQLLPALVQAGLLSKDAAAAYSQFRDLRNRVVHRASSVSDHELFRIIDVGLELLKAIRAVPAEVLTVANPGFAVFEDPDCTKEYRDIKGIALRAVSPGMEMVRLWGVSKKKVFQVGQVVTKEWDCDRKYNEAWYIDEGTKQKQRAWTGICEFVGAPVTDL